MLCRDALRDKCTLFYQAENKNQFECKNKKRKNPFEANDKTLKKQKAKALKNPSSSSMESENEGKDEDDKKEKVEKKTVKKSIFWCK